MDAVVAGQVARRLGGRDDVVSRDRIIQVRHVDFDDLGARVAIAVDGVIDRLLNRRLCSGVETRSDADPESLDGLVELLQIIVHRRQLLVDAGAVGRIVSGDHVQQHRRIGYGLPKRPDLVETGADTRPNHSGTLARTWA